MTHIAQDMTLAGLCFHSGKERGFVYGADIPEFDDLTSAEDVFELIEQADAILGAVVKPCPLRQFAVLTVSPLVAGWRSRWPLTGLWLQAVRRRGLGFRNSLRLMQDMAGPARALRRIKADHVLDMVLSGRLLGAARPPAGAWWIQ